LARTPDLARDARDEDALREACALPGVEWEYLRFVRDDGNNHWRPAAGTFRGWPQRVAEITYCDPCCGSGHFLVEAFVILAALHQQQEGLSAEEAARAVLRDNLHGLEIDGRCVQIAAFNVALAAWRRAGGPVDLPAPHIAWVGAPPPLPKPEFIALANGNAELRRGLNTLHDIFRQAPLLGSLIELSGGDLVDLTRIARIEQSIGTLVEKMRGAEPELAEGALAARGIADAAVILSQRFTLQATNVPFLGLTKASDELQTFVQKHIFSEASDLYAACLLRMRNLRACFGTIALVTPQNWYTLVGGTPVRKLILARDALDLICDLGPAAFNDMNWWAQRTALTILSQTNDEPGDHVVSSLDAERGKGPEAKAENCRQVELTIFRQHEFVSAPNCAFLMERLGLSGLLDAHAMCLQGISTGDSDRLTRIFSEVGTRGKRWRYYQRVPDGVKPYSGMEMIVDHSSLRGADAVNPAIRGEGAWGKYGIIFGQMRHLPYGIYTGERYSNSSPVMVPVDDDHKLTALWAFVEGGAFLQALRKINRKPSVDNGYFTKVEFDFAHWQKVATKQYPNGLPEPYSDDPTQWLFHGHPCYAEAGTELHIALARLAGYRWPAESDAEMRLSVEARAHIAEAANLPEADADGLLPLVPVLGKRTLADRLRAYCAAAWGEFWTSGSEAALIARACERAKDRPPKQLTFDAWLRGHAARQHAKLFHDRPFLWWITDGRSDGFTVVTHYHRLDRANLERVTYSMLNDWIDRQGDHPHVEAARILQDKLARILEGEKPYDIFVRWKPLERQPLGWEPDLDDGVRLNIRPFIEAKVLAHVPNVRYGVDRGKDVPSAPWYHLFAGERRNDHHTSLAEKRAARAGKAAE
jgi:hypothetical protein